MLSQASLALVALSAAAVAAYNFQDNLFNELLADELEDWSQDYARVRREADNDEVDKFIKCKHHQGKSCCGSGRWLKHFGDRDKKFVSSCFADFNKKLTSAGISTDEDPFSCAKVNQMKMKIICTTECVAKKSNLLHENGSMSAEKALDYMEDLELEDWQEPILQNAIVMCASIANSTKLSTPDTGDIQCNPVLLNLQHCLYRETLKHCPEEHKRTDRKCKNKYEHLETNSISTENKP